MAEKKPRPVEYFDPEGKTQTGYFLDDHVYVDEQATQPIPAGSTFRAGNGNYYRMTPYGGVLWSSAKQVDEQGNWINQGSQWYVRAQDLMGQIQNRAPFAYDAATDPLYLQARGETVRQGRRAMEDAQALTAQLTGGYDSSYSRQVGEQAFHEHLSRLANLLPELYDRAKDGYDDETRALYDQVDGLLGLYDLDYQTYLDKVGRDQAEAERADAQARYEQDRLDALAREQAKQDAVQTQQADRDRDYAYKLVFEALKAGKMPTRDLLAAAGLDPTLAEQIRQYYANRG